MKVAERQPEVTTRRLASDVLQQVPSLTRRVRSGVFTERSRTSAKKNATLSASRKNAELLALPSQTSFPSGATVFLLRVWLKLHNRESYYPLSHVIELQTSTSKASRITELVNFYLDIQKHNFACCFVWVRKLDSHIQAGT